jgi:hypothetical protein
MAEGTELEFAGVRFKGGKIFGVILALGTLVGGLYGGFEVYKDYMDMKEKIASYEAPDLSGFEQQLAVLRTEMGAARASVEETAGYARDVKNGLRDDITRLEKIVDQVEDNVKQQEVKVRELIDIADGRFENKRDQLQNDYDQKAESLRVDSERKLKDLEDRLNSRLQRALDNPLAN